MEDPWNEKEKRRREKLWRPLGRRCPEVEGGNEGARWDADAHRAAGAHRGRSNSCYLSWGAGDEEEVPAGAMPSGRQMPIEGKETVANCLGELVALKRCPLRRRCPADADAHRGQKTAGKEVQESRDEKGRSRSRPEGQ